MSVDDARHFVEALRNSGLLSGAELATISEQFRLDGTAPPQDLAARLVAQRTLSPFQAEQILSGKGDQCVLAARYRIIEQLGAGAMGTVYKATDTKLDRTVAIKVLPGQSVSDPAAVARFDREAKALAKLAHPNIVQAYDSGEDRGRHFLVMECVEGTSLAQLISERGRITPTLAADFVYQAAIGLRHAHERGLVHRDLKPSNLFLTHDRTLKVLDLGLARFLQDQVGDTTLTREGVGMGTPDYMAPEQFHDARHVDERSDIYSLGCTLYHMIAGQVPFPGSSLSEKYAAHETKEPPPIEVTCPEVPAGLAIAVSRMMAKRPADRFQSAREVAEALAPYVAGSSHAILQIRATANWHGSQLGLSIEPPRLRRRRRLLIGSSAAVTAGVIIALAFWLGRTLWPDEWSGFTGNPSSGIGSSPAVLPSEDPMILTVAHDGSGQFQSISDALNKVQPGMTIRVLDDAIYREELSVSRVSSHRGIAIESPNRATIESSKTAALIIHDVPDCRISGLRIRAKGTVGMALLGNVHGVVLDGLELEGNASMVLTHQQDSNSLIGVAAEGVDIADEHSPVVIQNCTIRRFSAGVRVSAIQADYRTAQPGRRIVIRENKIEDCSVGIVLVGRVQKVQAVANRIVGSTMAAIQLETLFDGAEDILVANNSVWESKFGFRLWGEAVRGQNIQISNNLIIGNADSPDMLFVDSGGDRVNSRGPGNGRLVLETWQWHNNWRVVRQPKASDPNSPAWIPLGPTDVIVDDMAFVSTDRASPDFLRPFDDSKLAESGAGNSDPTLPAYVGALPPPSGAEWDWQKTWEQRWQTTADLPN